MPQHLRLKFWQAKAVQLITGKKLDSFLTPDMASKTMPDIISFLSPCLVSKNLQTLCPQSIAQVRIAAHHLVIKFNRVVGDVGERLHYIIRDGGEGSNPLRVEEGA